MNMILKPYSLVLCVLCIFTYDASAQVLNETKEALCKPLSVYQKPAGVDFVPGVDANGNAVDSADLYPTANIVAPEIVTIPITVDTAEYIGIQVPEGIEMQAAIGSIEVNTQTGQVLYQGQDISSNVLGYCNDDEGTKANQQLLEDDKNESE